MCKPFLSQTISVAAVQQPTIAQILIKNNCSTVLVGLTGVYAPTHSINPVKSLEIEYQNMVPAYVLA